MNALSVDQLIAETHRNYKLIMVGDALMAPWELTDTIDRGDTATAIELLHRMLGAGRHPLQLMATLHTHYARMLRLDLKTPVPQVVMTPCAALRWTHRPSPHAV